MFRSVTTYKTNSLASHHSRSNNNNNGFGLGANRGNASQVRFKSTDETKTDSTSQGKPTTNNMSAMGLGVASVAAAIAAFFWFSDDKDKAKSSTASLTSSPGSKSPTTTSVGNKEEKARVRTDSKPDVVFFLGGAGSRKDELVTESAKEFGWTVINTELLIENEIASGSEKGKLLQKKREKGEKFPPEMVIELVESSISKDKNKRFIIADFPRTGEDANVWDQKMNDKVNLRMVFLVQHPTAGHQQQSGDMDQAYAKGGKRSGDVSYTQQSLPIISHYMGVTQVDDTKSKREIMSQLRDVMAYVDNEQIQSPVVGHSTKQRIEGKK